MKIAMRCFASLLAVVALTAAVGGIYISFRYKDEEPVLLEPSQEASDAATALLDAVCAGDYETAGSLILGSPELGVDRPAQDAVGVLLWDAYQDSLEYVPVGEPFATDSGVAQRFTVRYLDLSSVTATLRERSQALLEERVAQAEDTSEVYDENNEYREDVVMDVLYDAAVAALAEDARYVEVTFTMKLVYRDGRWLAVADDELLNAISGSLAG